MVVVIFNNNNKNNGSSYLGCNTKKDTRTKSWLSRKVS